MHTSLRSGFVAVVSQRIKTQPYGHKAQGSHENLLRVVQELLEQKGSTGHMTGVWRIPKTLAQDLVTDRYNLYYNTRYRKSHKGIRDFLSIVFQDYAQCTLVFQDHQESYLVR